MVILWHSNHKGACHFLSAWNSLLPQLREPIVDNAIVVGRNGGFQLDAPFVVHLHTR
jgi:hypothetical protein